MNKKFTGLAVMTALVMPQMWCWADDVNATGNNNDVLKHPVNKKASDANKDLREDEVKAHS